MAHPAPTNGYSRLSRHAIAVCTLHCRKSHDEAESLKIAYGVNGSIESPCRSGPRSLPTVTLSASFHEHNRDEAKTSSSLCYVVCCAGTNHTHNYSLCTNSHLLHTTSNLNTSGNACTSHNPEAEAGPSCTHRGGSLESSMHSDLYRCNNHQIHIRFPSPSPPFPSPSPPFPLTCQTELKPMSISSLSSCSTPSSSPVMQCLLR